MSMPQPWRLYKRSLAVTNIEYIYGSLVALLVSVCALHVRCCNRMIGRNHGGAKLFGGVPAL